MENSSTRRKWLAAAVAVIVMGLVLLIGYSRRDTENIKDISEARASLLRAAPITLAPGVHLLGGLAPAAAYVIETPKGLVLIDAGLEADASTLKQQMTKLELDWRKVCAILLTHVHADHSGGAQCLRGATGAKVYAGWADSQVLRQGGPREAFFSTFHMPKATAQTTTVDVELKGDALLDFGDVRLQALATPGHTPGSTCYLLEREGLRILFSGDVIMSLAGNAKYGPRLSSPLGTYAAYLAPRYRGNARPFLATLERLRALPVPDLILPGHPRMDPTPPNPSLSQQHWEAMLDQGIGDMRKLLARFERDGAHFLDGTPQKLLPDLYYFGDFSGQASYGFVASSKLFVVGGPRAAGMLEFVAARATNLGLPSAMPAALLLTSAAPMDLKGLDDFLGKSRATQVIVAPEAVANVKAAFPNAVTISTKELPEKGWFDVKVLPLRGRGQRSTGYSITCGGKSVLFSGPVPFAPAESLFSEIISEFHAGRANRLEFLDSLRRIAELTPDFWLPANPMNDQNACLYDRDWDSILKINQMLAN